MKLPSWLDELLEYINNNMLLIMKAIVASLCLIAGPIIAILLRMQMSNYSTIITTGIIFEIIGVVLFALIVKKEYLKDDSPIEESDAPKKKGKRAVPQSI